MTSKDIVKVFRELFPDIVIEKWLPGGQKQPNGKRDPQSIRIIDTKGKKYQFTYHKKDDWVLRTWCLRKNSDC